jgi:uncharacterized protein YkwD
MRSVLAIGVALAVASLGGGLGCSSTAVDGWTDGPGGGKPGGGQSTDGGSASQGDAGGEPGPGADGGSETGSTGGTGIDASAGDDAGATSGHDAGGPTGADAGGSTPESGTGGPFDPFQQHNLDVINMYRATLNLPPYTLDTQLSDFAAAGSQELSQDHMPHAHFMNAGNSLWSSGFNTSAGENQGDPNGWPQASSDPTTNETTQIDQIQKAMFDEGPGTGSAHGHYENMMSTTFTRVGVGLLEVGGQLYLTNDFSN